MIKGFNEFTWLPVRPTLGNIMRKRIKMYFEKYLAGLFDWIIKQYCEMPIGYTENSFSGYLAQAAYATGWYAIVDYVDRPKNSNKDSENHTYRPDLYLAMSAEQEDNMVFEVKKEWIQLDSHPSTISRYIIRSLENAYSQIDRHENPKEAKYRCSLGVIYVGCSKTRWSEIKNADTSIYNEKVKKFREIFSNTIQDRQCWSVNPNFSYLYFLNRTNSSHDDLFQVKNPCCLGCLVVGLIERSKE